mmetsp:Transcript_33432/g.76341  ORF Transcript_33432/g.76341 Transcript_33432/m.76341 type:complete len:680 (-) Transcript_33432:215-2254(-)
MTRRQGICLIRRIILVSALYQHRHRASALPRNNKGQGEGSALTKPAPGGGRREHQSTSSASRSRQTSIRGSGNARSDVSLHDSFPCGAGGSDDCRTTNAPSIASGAAGPTAGPMNTTFLTRNSFAAQNNLDCPNQSDARNYKSTRSISEAMNTRGGASAVLSSTSPSDLTDDVLDQMVDDLILGTYDDNRYVSQPDEGNIDEPSESQSGEISEDEAETDIDSGDWEEPAEAHSRRRDVECVETEREVKEKEIDGGAVATATEGSTKYSALKSPARHLPQQPPTIESIVVSTTPTNAYYRFLVRRGPKGHFLAAFTLLSVQWIHTYLPFVYQSVALVLLKLRIYNPRILYDRERRRLYEARYGKPKKRGVMSKLFGSSSAAEKNAQVKQADQEATSKLKELYKVMKDGSEGILSEVKYRYLSVDFRRRHQLGNEYRIEKPRAFMGEVVEGSNVDGDATSDEVVLSDAEDEEDTTSEGSSTSSGDNRRIRRVRRKVDWTAKAFMTPPRGSNKPPQVWNMVERDDIISAAMKSVSAERSFVRGRRKATARTSSGLDEYGDIEEDSPSLAKSGGYAGTMLKSVMNRVGSNGRVFGAYPNDAPPIEQCANERGVIELARRYGYGQWTEWNPSLQEEEESSDFGGGDLFDDDSSQRVDYRRRRSGGNSDVDTMVKRRKRRRRKKS